MSMRNNRQNKRILGNANFQSTPIVPRTVHGKENKENVFSESSAKRTSLYQHSLNSFFSVEKHIVPLTRLFISPKKDVTEFEMNSLDSSMKELMISVTDKSFVDLTIEQRGTFFHTFIKKMEKDVEIVRKNGGYDMFGRLRTVSGFTVSGLVSLYSSFPHFCSIYILDCRSHQEFDAGHVKCAQNVEDNFSLKFMYIKLVEQHKMDPKRLYVFIFYCEFSSKRAPSIMTKFMRLAQDNLVFLDNVYLLDRGYRGFFELFKGFCEPMDYFQN